PARAPQRFDALEVMRSHREHQIRVAYQLLRERLRAMLAEIEAALHPHEERAVRCRRPIPGARASADELEVRESALDRHLARDGFGDRAPTGVPGADEKNAHSTQASPMRLGTLSRSTSAGMAPGRMTRG